MSQNHGSPPQDDFARALLRSAEMDEPSPAAYAKVAAGLGVSTVLGVGASLPAPAVLAGSSALARWSSTLGGKLALLGVSGALLGAGGALLQHRLLSNHANSRPVQGTAVPARALPAPGARVQAAANGVLRPSANGATAVSSATEVGSPNGANAVNAASAPTLEASNVGSSAEPLDADAEAALLSPRPARAVVRAPGAARAPGAGGSSLSEQVQSLDRARVALGSGDAGAALVEIAHYRKTWPKGVFLTEASVLEIEALAKRGEHSLAAARAQAFVTAHPDSPQAERLRALSSRPASE